MVTVTYDLEWAKTVIKEHFYSSLTYEKPIKEYTVNRGLNYLICIACDRLINTFGEVTKKDVILLAEAWVIKQSNVAGGEPLRLIGEPEPR